MTNLGNIVGNAYIRKVTRKDGRLVNSVIKTYPNVSQFWTYDEKEFLKNPVYSRDYPAGKIRGQLTFVGPVRPCSRHWGMADLADGYTQCNSGSYKG